MRRPLIRLKASFELFPVSFLPWWSSGGDDPVPLAISTLVRPSFAAASFLVSILAVLFYVVEIINTFTLVIFAAALIFSIVVLKNQRE